MKKVLTMTAVACFLAVSVFGCKSNDNGTNGNGTSDSTGSTMNNSGSNGSTSGNGGMSQ